MSDLEESPQQVEKELTKLNEQLAINSKKIDEIESRINKMISICQQVNEPIAPEIASSIAETIKEARKKC